ncbi:MAG: hypothetical protein WC365_03250 [Candidatus Babeliales bacterium]|jgi:hypothetical protein
MHIRFFLLISTCLLIPLTTVGGIAQCQRPNSTPTPSPIPRTFKLLTTLYNEKNDQRATEFITCMENNLRNSSIDTIHVLYDTAKDDKQGSVILTYLKSRNITISYIPERATYGDFFKLANERYSRCKIIVSNADIFFNETLTALEPYDVSNKFLTLTRWNVDRDGTLVAFDPTGGCQDTWIFQTPLPKFENDAIKIGILECEHAIAYQAKQSGLELCNPSLSIQCCHLHLSEIRNYARTTPYRNMGKIRIIPKCTVMEIDEQQRNLFRKNLRVNAGRRKPIIVG